MQYTEKYKEFKHRVVGQCRGHNKELKYSGTTDMKSG
jgi:hypothetical protein